MDKGSANFMVKYIAKVAIARRSNISITSPKIANQDHNQEYYSAYPCMFKLVVGKKKRKERDN